MQNLLPEEKLVFSSIKINPSDDELAGLNSLLAQVSDWQQAEKLLIDNSAAQFLYRKLPFLSNKTLIPDSVFVNLKQAYLHTFRFNFALYDAFSEAMKKFDENGVKIIPLKGVYLAEKLYSDIGLRQMSDIDLLVQAKDAEKAMKILGEMGYVSDNYYCDTPEERMIHFPAMRRGEISFEIKRMLDENEGTTIT
ncbi:MAG: nucleotidyltransferase family protein, partial [Paludibacter sp.]|nr:nucleotidyltransferase family protein [Paludibacter sp.]